MRYVYAVKILEAGGDALIHVLPVLFKNTNILKYYWNSARPLRHSILQYVTQIFEVSLLDPAVVYSWGIKLYGTISNSILNFSKLIFPCCMYRYSKDDAPEAFFLDTILNRHARKLLASNRLKDLGRFSAYLDFHLREWLRKERYTGVVTSPA